MNSKKFKTVLCVLLIITGLSSVIMGITVLATPDYAHVLRDGNFYYENHWEYDNSYQDRGYAKFNNDFYTYLVNNSATAAAYAYRAAGEVEDTKNLVRNIGGYLLIIIGLITHINGYMKMNTSLNDDVNAIRNSQAIIEGNIIRGEIADNKNTHLEDDYEKHKTTSD